jgi:hypothetical protein
LSLAVLAVVPASLQHRRAVAALAVIDLRLLAKTVVAVRLLNLN